MLNINQNRKAYLRVLREFKQLGSKLSLTHFLNSKTFTALKGQHKSRILVKISSKSLNDHHPCHSRHCRVSVYNNMPTICNPFPQNIIFVASLSSVCMKQQFTTKLVHSDMCFSSKNIYLCIIVCFSIAHGIKVKMWPEIHQPPVDSYNCGGQECTTTDKIDEAIWK